MKLFQADRRVDLFQATADLENLDDIKLEVKVNHIALTKEEIKDVQKLAQKASLVVFAELRKRYYERTGQLLPDIDPNKRENLAEFQLEPKKPEDSEDEYLKSMAKRLMLFSWLFLLVGWVSVLFSTYLGDVFLFAALLCCFCALYFAYRRLK